MVEKKTGFELFRERKDDLRYGEFARKLDALILHSQEENAEFFDKCRSLANEAYECKKETQLLRRFTQICKARKRQTPLARKNIARAWVPLTKVFSDKRYQEETFDEFLEVLANRPEEVFERFWLFYDANKIILPFGQSLSICDKTHFHLNGPLLNPSFTNAAVISKLRDAMGIYLAGQVEAAADENGHINVRALSDLAQQADELVKIDEYLIEKAREFSTWGVRDAEAKVECEIVDGKMPNVYYKEQYKKHNKNLEDLNVLEVPFTCPAMLEIYMRVKNEKRKAAEREFA